MTKPPIPHWLFRYILRNYSMPLTPETQAKIDAAFAAKQVAVDDDAAVETAQVALDAADHTHSEAVSAAVTAHMDHATKAHDALVSLAADFGVVLPA